MDLLLSSGTGGVTGIAFVSSAAATKVDCLLLFLKSTLLFLTFLMRKHTVLIDGFLSLKIQFQQLFMRLRDVPPSHISKSLDVKPSEVRTVDVSTS